MEIRRRGVAEQKLEADGDELRTIVDAMADREVRTAELKETIRKLRTQLESAGLTPVADDPLKLERRLDNV